MKNTIILFLLAFLSLNSSAQLIGQAGESSVYKAKIFSILPDGTNQAANFTAAIAAIPAGGVLDLERGKTYSISSTITINKAITLQGNGAIINYTGSSGSIVVAIASSGVTIDNLTVTSTYGSYVSGSNLIGTSGNTASSFYTDITVKNCTLYNSQSSGIYIQYSRNVIIDNNYIHDMPYRGVGFYSVTDGKIINNRIYDITALGTTSANSYGVTVQQLGTDTICRNILIDHNEIRRSPWEGLDDHGGQYLTFSNNTVLDCGVGIASVASSSGAPSQVKIINNHIQSTDNTSSGISVAGLSTPSYNTGAQVIGNTIVGQHIRLQETKGAVVSNNIIKESATNYGILLKGNGGVANNVNLTIKDNKIIDVYTAGSANTYAIFMDDNNNTATITGNSLISGTGSGTNKNRYGFSTAVGSTGCEAYIGDNDFSGATIAAYKSDGVFASRFLGNIGTTITSVSTSAVYTVTQTDKVILYEYTTGGTTMNLPAITKLNDDREIWITNLSSGTLTTNLAMYTKAATSGTTIAAGTKVHLTYDFGNSKIWRD